MAYIQLVWLPRIITDYVYCTLYRQSPGQNTQAAVRIRFDVYYFNPYSKSRTTVYRNYLFCDLFTRVILCIPFFLSPTNIRAGIDILCFTLCCRIDSLLIFIFASFPIEVDVKLIVTTRQFVSELVAARDVFKQYLPWNNKTVSTVSKFERMQRVQKDPVQLRK